MATRSTLDAQILACLTEFESSESDPSKISELASELEVKEMEVFNALGRLEDAGKVSASGRGMESVWWVVKDTPKEAPKPKRTRRTKAQMDEARKAERDRLEYNTRVAESQEPGSQHVHPMEDARPVDLTDTDRQRKEGIARIMDKVKPEFKAQTPVIAENGETVTVPVDWDDESKGRRELDASKGERVLSEGSMADIVARIKAGIGDMADKVDNIETLIAEELTAFTVTFHEPKNGEALDCTIPPLPEGVHPHTWELAHQGNTEGARRYHMRQAQAQMDEYAETRAAEEFMAAMLEVQNESPELETPPF